MTRLLLTVLNQMQMQCQCSILMLCMCNKVQVPLSNLWRQNLDSMIANHKTYTKHAHMLIQAVSQNDYSVTDNAHAIHNPTMGLFGKWLSK